jgi:predicted DNA-binding transcriptional regulator AlpA
MEAQHIKDNIAANIQIRPRQAAEILGWGLSTFWKRAKTDPRFPRLRRFGARCTTLSLLELNRYIDEAGAV